MKIITKTNGNGYATNKYLATNKQIFGYAKRVLSTLNIN